MNRFRPSLPLVLCALLAFAASGSAGVIEDFNALLARSRQENKDVFLVVISPVQNAEPFARLLASDPVRQAYQDRFLAFPVFLGKLKETAPEERARMAALLELFQAEPGPHPVFVFLRPDGVAYHITRPTLSPTGMVEVNSTTMRAIFDEETLTRSRRDKATFLSVVDTVSLRPGAAGARELAGLLERLPPEHRRLPEGRRALGKLLQRLQGNPDPALEEMRKRWQQVALRDAQLAALWQVRRLAWAADIQASIDTAEDICRTSLYPKIRREACLSGAQVLIALDKPGALAKAKELLVVARQAAVNLGEHANDRDPVTGIPGATPENIDKTLADVEEARAKAHGATSKVIRIEP